MRDAFLLALLGLAAYGATRFVTTDTIIERQRSWLLERVPAKLAEGLTCPWCVGSWIAFTLTAIAWRYASLPLPGLWFLAVRVLVGLLAKIGDE